MDGLLEIYRELDETIHALKVETGLSCVEGCGKCCETPNRNIEASVLEVIPLALALWENGTGDFWLKRLEQYSDSDFCIFYHSEPLFPGTGKCSVYPLRPLLCRLFGFAAKTGKNGEIVFSLCRKVKEVYPGLKEAVQQKILEGTEVPVCSDFGRRVEALNPLLGNRKYPINTAIRMALEKIGYRMLMLESNRDDKDKNPPVQPPVPEIA
jgi:Fe-S-cluster containining protein